jgi:hypothetical protein
VLVQRFFLCWLGEKKYRNTVPGTVPSMVP